MVSSVDTLTEEKTSPGESRHYGERLRISVIIPARPGDSSEKAIAAITTVEYPRDLLEIIVVEGTQPSAQRNAAVKMASGEIVYFLDNDSEADIDLFRYVARSFADPQVAVVGGPSEILPSDSLLQKCFGYVLGSFFAVANVRCRYKAIGRAPQQTTEHKLILCNLGVRRTVFLETGGFDERLYPNEENELLNRLRARGYALIYNPRAVVRRPHRTSLAGFVRQMFSYGRGRMQQFLLHPQFVNPAYLVPLAFLVYLASLPAAIVLAMYSEIFRWYFLPAGLYLFASGLSTGRIVIDEEDWRPAFVTPALFFVIHVCYAVGMIAGLLGFHSKSANQRRPANQRSSSLMVKVLKSFGLDDRE